MAVGSYEEVNLTKRETVCIAVLKGHGFSRANASGFNSVGFQPLREALLHERAIRRRLKPCPFKAIAL